MTEKDTTRQRTSDQAQVTVNVQGGAPCKASAQTFKGAVDRQAVEVQELIQTKPIRAYAKTLSSRQVRSRARRVGDTKASIIQCRSCFATEAVPMMCER